LAAESPGFVRMYAGRGYKRQTAKPPGNVETDGFALLP
jgi:hypothetical protein